MTTARSASSTCALVGARSPPRGSSRARIRPMRPIPRMGSRHQRCALLCATSCPTLQSSPRRCSGERACVRSSWRATHLTVGCDSALEHHAPYRDHFWRAFRQHARSRLVDPASVTRDGEVRPTPSFIRRARVVARSYARGPVVARNSRRRSRSRPRLELWDARKRARRRSSQNPSSAARTLPTVSPELSASTRVFARRPRRCSR